MKQIDSVEPRRVENRLESNQAADGSNSLPTRCDRSSESVRGAAMSQADARYRNAGDSIGTKRFRARSPS